MGTGLNSQSSHQVEHLPSRRMTQPRNLHKSQLGGVIFGCTKVTMRECLANQLFGLPSKHFSYVKNIGLGLPLFLFNYSERKLYGIFEAASSGKMNINSYAWTGDGSDRTMYPAQVQIRLRQHCQPLSEHQFKPVIVDNYYNQTHFWFELDHAQTSKLMYKFLSSVGPGPSLTQNLPKQTTVIEWLPANKKKSETEGSQSSLLATDVLTNSHDSVGTSSTFEDSLCLDGNNQLNDEVSCDKMLEFSEKDLIHLKLKELAMSSEYSVANIGHVVGSRSANDVELAHETYDDDMVISQRNGGSSTHALDYPVIIEQLFREIDELKAFRQEQTQKMESLEKKLAVAELQIHRLSRCKELESTSDSSLGVSGEERSSEHDELHGDLNESILIVGGYNGESWSSALDSFSPIYDVMTSLKPMPCARSYASVTRFNGELYVLGGGIGSTWYDTVESYNVVQNEWRLCPSLAKEKGSLASAAVNGKIFAIGGGNGLKCFSDVEMLDPYVGRWIPARSMLEKRFALTAVEFNGALYAVGGYDGNDYLKTAERFDPREHSWTKIGSMNTKRGCHSLVVMNEKLYVVGGFDGVMMIPTVEIYDPRVGTWLMGEPLSEGKGYFSAAVVKESIYAIGGVKANESITERIECYKEGQGWETTGLRAVGKRCFASAAVLQGDCGM